MSYEFTSSENDPENDPDSWQNQDSEDDLEIASESGLAPEQTGTFLGRITFFFSSIFSHYRNKANSDGSSLIGDDQDLQIGSHPDYDSQKHTDDEELNDISSRNPSGREQDSSTITDDYFIAGKSGPASFSEIDDQIPNAQYPVSAEPEPDDFVVLKNKKASKQPFRDHITADEIEIVGDEFQIANKSQHSKADKADQDSKPDPGPTDKHDSDSYLDEFGSEEPNRQKLKSILQDQLVELMTIMENPRQDFSEPDGVSNTETESSHDDPQTASVGDTRFSFILLILKTISRTLRWISRLPRRALFDTGSISDIKRRKLEPFILGLPALFILVSIYLWQIRIQTKNLLSESSRFNTLTRQKLKSGDFNSAYIAARLVCNQSKTPANLWRLAEVLLTSQSATDQLRANELINALASPENGDFADAHLFLARKAWNSESMKVEEVPKLLNLVKYHLRSGFSAEPNRVDLLESLLDLLMTTGEYNEVIRLATPRLESWPTGYYYLARIAFKQGDRLNQEIYARFIVNRYESLSGVIAESTQDRERYLLCLALSGQWSKAEPLLNDWLSELDGEKSILFWKNRFLAIKALGLLESKPDEYQPVVSEVIDSISKSPENHELWNALTRFADRKSPLSDEFYKSGIQLVNKYRKILDSTELMIWGNLARKKNDSGISRELLEESVLRDPENIIAANNLANLLYKLDPKDPARALKLIENVLKSEPDNLIFIETRGQILAELGEDDKAIYDLTRSLTAFPEVSEIHETLIRLYRRKGKPDLVKIHETRLREINEKLENQNQSRPKVKTGSADVKP